MLYYNPETGDVTYAPSGSPPQGYVPLSGTPADQVAKPSGEAQTGPLSNSSTSLVDPNLIAQLQAKNVKITPENVLATGTMPNGKIVWLESGDDDSGLAHIVAEHLAQFTSLGATEAELPAIIMEALTRHDEVGTQGRNRTIYLVAIDGVDYRIAINVSANGYIVGASMKGRAR